MHACIADLFNSFCEQVYVVAFFKVMWQQTAGDVANSITRFWIDNFCLQQWKNYYYWTVFAKVDQIKKGPVFPDSQCRLTESDTEEIPERHGGMVLRIWKVPICPERMHNSRTNRERDWRGQPANWGSPRK